MLQSPVDLGGPVLDILIVDDHALLRAGLECMFEATSDLRVVGSAADGDDALRLAEQLRPDVVLMDLFMPGMDGLEATALVRRLPDPPTVVILSTTCAALLVRAAFDAGAAGYLVKDMPPERLLDALRGLADGRPALDPRAARILERRRRRDHGEAPLPFGAVVSPRRG